MSSAVRLDRLIGRQVLTANNRRLGRLEECRLQERSGAWVVTEWIIGPVGLLERLGLGTRLIVGRKRGGYIARWDQLDLSNPERPRLSCVVDALRRL
jgi:sporulation protein YlmC with PRC-barrel domain